MKHFIDAETFALKFFVQFYRPLLRVTDLFLTSHTFPNSYLKTLTVSNDKEWCLIVKNAEARSLMVMDRRTLINDMARCWTVM
jgi:hypothetical protein